MSRMITIEDTAYILRAMFPVLNKYSADNPPPPSAEVQREDISPLPADTEIVILTHRYPDGDTLGSAFAMCGMLRNEGLNARVAVNGTLNKKFMFMAEKNGECGVWGVECGVKSGDSNTSFSGTSHVNSTLEQKSMENSNAFGSAHTENRRLESDRSGSYNKCGKEENSTLHTPHSTLVIAVDIASPEQLGDLREEFESTVFLSIDHHAMNTPFARYTCERKAAANAENIYELFRLLNVPMDKHIADCLYTGICTDTGCFRFANVTPRTMRTAAQLMDMGADSAAINRAVYETNTIAHLKMQEYALSTLAFYGGGKIAVIYTTLEMEQKAGASESDMDGISSIPRTIEGVAVGITLKEKAQGMYRVSVRTVPGYNAADICARFDGGGHHAAAGCTLYGTLEKAVERIVAAALETL